MDSLISISHPLIQEKRLIRRHFQNLLHQSGRFLVKEVGAKSHHTQMEPQ